MRHCVGSTWPADRENLQLPRYFADAPPRNQPGWVPCALRWSHRDLILGVGRDTEPERAWRAWHARASRPGQAARSAFPTKAAGYPLAGQRAGLEDWHIE